MRRLTAMFMWNALVSTALTVATFIATSRLLAYAHGMPDPRLSALDTFLSVSVTCLVALLLPAVTYTVYSRRPSDERLAATLPMFGNLMSTLFAVSAYFQATGLAMIGVGAAVGIVSAFVGVRAGMEQKVGNGPMLAVIIAQIVVVTGLI